MHTVYHPGTILKYDRCPAVSPLPSLNAACMEWLNIIIHWAAGDSLQLMPVALLPFLITATE